MATFETGSYLSHQVRIERRGTKDSLKIAVNWGTWGSPNELSGVHSRSNSVEEEKKVSNIVWKNLSDEINSQEKKEEGGLIARFLRLAYGGGL